MAVMETLSCRQPPLLLTAESSVTVGIPPQIRALNTFRRLLIQDTPLRPLGTEPLDLLGGAYLSLRGATGRCWRARVVVVVVVTNRKRTCVLVNFSATISGRKPWRRRWCASRRRAEAWRGYRGRRPETARVEVCGAAVASLGRRWPCW